MASTASDIQAQAAVDAWLNSRAVKSMQQDISDAYNNRLSAIQSSNQSALDMINQNYQAGTQSAYINKMQSDRSLTDYLTRLGLEKSGYGASQYLQSQADYGQNLASLQNALNENYLKQNQIYSNQLADIYGEYGSQRYNMNKYLADTVNDIRQQTLDNSLKEYYYNYLYSTTGSNKSGGGGSAGISLSGDDSQNISLDENQTPQQQNAKELNNVLLNVPVEKNYKDVASNGWTTSKVEILKRLGLSTATDWKKLIDNKIVTEMTENGKTYYNTAV